LISKCFLFLTAEDFDWEEEHEKFAEIVEPVPSKVSANKTRDSGYDTSERSYRSQEVGTQASLRLYIYLPYLLAYKSRGVFEGSEETFFMDPPIRRLRSVQMKSLGVTNGPTPGA